MSIWDTGGWFDEVTATSKTQRHDKWIRNQLDEMTATGWLDEVRLTCKTHDATNYRFNRGMDEMINTSNTSSVFSSQVSSFTTCLMRRLTALMACLWLLMADGQTAAGQWIYSLSLAALGDGMQRGPERKILQATVGCCSNFSDEETLNTLWSG